MSWEQAGHAWGRRAWDWALLQEPLGDCLYDAVLTAAEVAPGDRLLDIACGSGLAVQRAAGRGARCTGVDASAALLDIARERSPESRFLQAGMTDLPLDDGEFDVVVSFNGVQFGGPDALREAARVLGPGGRFGLGFWQEPGDFGPLFATVGRLAPPPPPGMASPFAFAEPGVAEDFCGAAGLRVERRGTVRCAVFYRTLDDACRGFGSSAPAAAAADHSGEDAVRQALAEVVAPHVDAGTGVVRMAGLMAWVAGTGG